MQQRKHYIPIKNLGCPYLTQQQNNDFQAQFTLFGKEVPIKKIEDAMLIQNYNKTDRLAKQFIETVRSQQKMTFQEYMQGLINFYQELDKHEAIKQILGNQQGQITQETVKECLQDALGRKIHHSQMRNIMEKVRKDDNLKRLIFE